MICPVCGDRFAPLRADLFKFVMNEKEGVKIEKLKPNSQEIYDELFNNDFNKCPCGWCQT